MFGHYLVVLNVVNECLMVPLRMFGVLLPNDIRVTNRMFGGPSVKCSVRIKNPKILLPTNPNKLGKLAYPPTKLNIV